MLSQESFISERGKESERENGNSAWGQSDAIAGFKDGGNPTGQEMRLASGSWKTKEILS